MSSINTNEDTATSYSRAQIIVARIVSGIGKYLICIVLQR